MNDKKTSLPRRILQMFPVLAFIFGVSFFSLLYGMLAMQKQWFPYHAIRDAFAGVSAVLPPNKARLWYYSKTNAEAKLTAYHPDQAANGLNKILSVEADFSLAVKIIDMNGAEVHRWRINWDQIWPDATHLTYDEIPQARPGTHVHGAKLLPDGDLVFSFEHLGLVRLDPCGQVVWKLPYRTHHSIFVDESGNLWVPGQINHATEREDLPLYRAPFIEPTILKVSPDGSILEEKSVFDLLRQNGQQGFLYSATVENAYAIVSGDTLHLNDVEVFPSTLKPGVFAPGDVMISLRNVNAVLVFEADTWRLKYKVTHEFVRQHDPDFVDGNHISIFDNNNVAPPEKNPHSRILIKSADTGEVTVPFTGSDTLRFFTNIMGKHQWLSNGNLLVNEAVQGRLLEITPDGRVAWDYLNIIEPGWVGLVGDVERLPDAFNKTFFKQVAQDCRQTD